MRKGDLKERVRALSTVTGLPVQAMDSAGLIFEQSGNKSAYCTIFQKYLPAGESCGGLHMMAGRRAVDLGEPYLFNCHAGMCHIAMPLLHVDEFEGAVLVGPFILGELDTLLVQDVAKRYTLPADALLDMFEAAGRLCALSPEKTKALCRMVFYLFESVDGSDILQGRHKKELQQRRIGESIQAYKGFQSAAPAYPYEKERALVRYVQAGDAGQANALLNDLLGYALFSTGGELETIKSCTAELCSLLSRAAIEGGVEAGDALYMNRSFMKTLWQARTIEELCYFMQEAVERFCKSAFPLSGAGERAMLPGALRYIHLHYMEPLTLETAAREAHLSASYFSTVFKKASGFSFSEYVNAVRVEEAKRLLAQGNLSVTAIALAVGFESQSYFSKVFHKVTATTPKEYRKKLHENKIKHGETGGGV